MIPLDKGPYLRSLSQSPTTLTLVLLQAVSVEIKVSQTAWRAPHFFYDTLYTLVHAFRGPSDKGLRSKLAETKQKPRRFSNGNWIGGKVEGGAYKQFIEARLNDLTHGLHWHANNRSHLHQRWAFEAEGSRVFEAGHDHSFRWQGCF